MRVFAASSGSLRFFIWIWAARSKAWPASFPVELNGQISVQISKDGWRGIWPDGVEIEYLASALEMRLQLVCRDPLRSHTSLLVHRRN